MNTAKTITHNTQIGVNTIVLAAKSPETENIDMLIISISNTIDIYDKINHNIEVQHCDCKYLSTDPYSKTSRLMIIYAAENQAATISIIHDTIIINYDSSIIKYVAVFDTDTEALTTCNTRTSLLQIVEPYFESGTPDPVNKPISSKSTILFDTIYPIAMISVDTNNMAIINPIVRILDTGEYGVIHEIGTAYHLNSTVAIDNLKIEVEHLKSRLDVDVVKDMYVITDSIYHINIAVSCDVTLDGGTTFYYCNNTNIRIYGIINRTTNDSETIDINLYRIDDKGALTLITRQELNILGVMEDN